MKISETHRTVALLLMVAWLTGGCSDNSASFTKVESERAKLINGIERYQTVEEFVKFLNRHSLKWQERGDRNVSSKDKRPPFNFYEITINNYSHLGYSGELLVVFFNNRLIDTTFYPKNFEKYLETLKKVEGIKFNDNREASIHPYTRVWFAANYEKRKYVAWADIRLEKEVDTWIKRYS